MRIFFFFILTLSLTLEGDILRVKIPYEFPVSHNKPIENEMILPPAPFLGKVDALQPLFGETRDAEVFFNDIPLNDPSAPKGIADLQYIHFGTAALREGGIFNLSLNKTLGRISLSNLGPEIRFSLPYRISPFIALSSQIFPHHQSRESLNAGVKGTFDMADTKVDFSVLKIKGKNRYKSHEILTNSESDLNGASIKLTSSHKVFITLKHMDITRMYGDSKVFGQTDSVEVGYFLFKNSSCFLKVLGEKDQDYQRSFTYLGWKNEDISFSIGFLEKEVYPEMTYYWSNSPFFFEAIGKRRPPKLSEMTMHYEIEPGKWVKIKSDNLTPETLFGGRFGWNHHIFNVEAGTDFLVSPILCNYATWENFNGPVWGKPFLKAGIGVDGASFSYKYTSPYFITNVSQMINIPVHHFNWKWDMEFSCAKVCANIDILSGVKRYNEISKSIINDGYEGRFSLKINRKPFFVEMNLISTDPSQRNNQLFTFCAGISIDTL